MCNAGYSVPPVSLGVAMINSSDGNVEVRLAKTLSNCSGGISATVTSRPMPGGASGERVSGIGFAVAILVRKNRAEAKSGLWPIANWLFMPVTSITIGYLQLGCVA